MKGQKVDIAEKADSDLWYAPLQQFLLSLPYLVAVLKIKAHAENFPQDDPGEDWAFQGNAAADKCAAPARQTMPGDFWHVWQQLAAESAELKNLGCASRAMYTDIAHPAQQNHSVPLQLPEPRGFVCEDPA